MYQLGRYIWAGILISRRLASDMAQAEMSRAQARAAGARDLLFLHLPS